MASQAIEIRKYRMPRSMPCVTCSPIPNGASVELDQWPGLAAAPTPITGAYPDAAGQPCQTAEAVLMLQHKADRAGLRYPAPISSTSPMVHSNPQERAYRPERFCGFAARRGTAVRIKVLESATGKRAG
jgi:hypothetical protein